MNKGLEGLEERVIRQDLCAACGACLSLCPYLRSWKGRIVKLDRCDLEEGRCFSYCPRTEVNLDAIYERIFGKRYDEIEIGPFKKIVMARARDPQLKKRAQTGGVVSALIDFALKEGVIDSGVLTPRDDELLPYGKIVKSRREILRCAGSSYVSGPTLEALNRGPWKGNERIGIVGLPCQVLAVGKMKASMLEKRTPIDRIVLVIGLFCTWALDYAPFTAFLKERVNGLPVKRIDITPPPDRILEVRAGKRLFQIPVDDIRPFVRPSCRVCLDMTAELSDLSVGTVEGREGWNMVIVRTIMGEELLRKAKKVGIIEARQLPKDHLDHLIEASLLKKRRALEGLKERGGMDSAYLIFSSDRIERIISASEEIKP